MWPFKKKIVEQPKPVEAAVVANPIVINPTDEQGLNFAEYRANAIARDREQRTERHPEHDSMTSEAMMYAHMLVAAKMWSEAELKKLEERLK